MSIEACKPLVRLTPGWLHRRSISRLALDAASHQQRDLLENQVDVFFQTSVSRHFAQTSRRRQRPRASSHERPQRRVRATPGSHPQPRQRPQAVQVRDPADGADLHRGLVQLARQDQSDAELLRLEAGFGGHDDVDAVAVVVLVDTDVAVFDVEQVTRYS